MNIDKVIPGIIKTPMGDDDIKRFFPKSLIIKYSDLNNLRDYYLDHIQ